MSKESRAIIYTTVSMKRVTYALVCRMADDMGWSRRQVVDLAIRELEKMEEFQTARDGVKILNTLQEGER